jgi:hypothetical protein
VNWSRAIGLKKHWKSGPNMQIFLYLRTDRHSHARKSHLVYQSPLVLHRIIQLAILPRPSISVQLPRKRLAETSGTKRLLTTLVAVFLAPD